MSDKKDFQSQTQDHLTVLHIAESLTTQHLEFGDLQKTLTTGHLKQPLQYQPSKQLEQPATYTQPQGSSSGKKSE